jgi:hypothetical protein
MTTGYTLDVGKGQSFNDFVLGCARAFGACISLRDEPQSSEIPEFEVGDYHRTGLATAKEALVDVLQLSEATLDFQASDDFNENLKAYKERQTENNTTQVAYTTMLEQVEQWTPPTTDHSKLKTFMLEQLSTGKDFDDYTPDVPVSQTGEEWLADKIKSLSWSIEYHTTEYNKEVKRVAEQNLWVKNLKESLNEI